MRPRYSWTRFGRFLRAGAAAAAAAQAVEPEEEPTRRIPVETCRELMRPEQRPAAELEAELAQNAEAGR